MKVSRLLSRLTELFHLFLASMSKFQVSVTRLRFGSITGRREEKEPVLLLEALERATEIESRLGLLSDVFTMKARLIKSYQKCNCYYNG